MTLKTLLKFAIPAAIIGLIAFGIAYGASVFNSSQVGLSPAAGKVLQTNGSTSTWVATSTLGIIGGSGTFSTTTINGLSAVNYTFATNTDTNITLSLATSAPGTLTFIPGFTGTLAAGRLNSNVVQGITNDTNVTGSIAAQNLTLGWTGTLADGRIASAANWNGVYNNVLSRLSVATGTAGNIFNIATSTNSLTINLPTASAANTGQLSSTDWTTFNNKQNTLTLPLSVANGGTGTNSPGLIQGTNITITGAWPNQTINASAGSGNSAWTIGNGVIYNATSTDSVSVGTSTKEELFNVQNQNSHYSTISLWNTYFGNPVHSILDADNTDSFNGIQGYTYLGSKTNHPLVLGFNNQGQCGIYSDNALDTLVDCYPPANGSEMTFTNSLPQTNYTTFHDNYLMNYGAGTGLQAGDIYAVSTATGTYPEIISGFWNQAAGQEALNTKWYEDIAPSGQHAIGSLNSTTTLLHTGPIIQLGASSTAKSELAVYGATVPSLTNSLFNVNQNGNVGIGTDTPTAALTINSTAGNLIGAYNNNVPQMILNNAGSLTTYGAFQAYVNGAGNQYFFAQNDGSGGVNFGAYNSGFVGFKIDGWPLALNSRASGQPVDIGASSGLSGALNVESNGNGSIFNAASSSGTSLFVISNSGNVNIATLTASTLLMADPNKNLQSVILGTNLSFSGNTLNAASSGGSGNSAWTIGSGLIYNATSTDLIGIGTITPTTTLYVQGKAGTSPFTIASSTGAALVQVNQKGQVFGTSINSQTPTYSFVGNTNTGIGQNGANSVNIATNGSNFYNFTTTGFQAALPYLSTYANGVSTPDITAFGDTGTGLWLSGNKSVGLSTGGIERLRFDPTGLAGINSSTPTATLVVQGYSGSTTPEFIVSSSTGASQFQVTALGNINIATLTASSLLMTDSNKNLYPVTLGTNLSFTGTTLNAAGGAGVSSVSGTAPITSSGGSTPAIGVNTGDLTLTSSNLSFGSGDGKKILLGTTTNITLTASPSFTNGTFSGTLGVTGLSTLASTTIGGTLTVTPLASCTNLQTSGAGLFSCNNTVYLTGNQTVTLSGAVTGSGATAITTSFQPGAFATGTTGNIFNIATTTSSLTINLPTASGSNSGQLSSTDWTTFNNKGAGTVTSVSGAGSILSSGGATPTIQLQNLTTSDILFGAGTNQIATSTNFTFTTGSNTLSVTGTSTISNFFAIGTTTPLVARFTLQNAAGTTDAFRIASSTGVTMSIFDYQGHLQIGTTSDTSNLAVQGQAGQTTNLLNVSSSSGASLFIISSSGAVTITATSTLATTTIAGINTVGYFDKSFSLASTTPDYQGNSFNTATFTIPSIWNPVSTSTMSNLFCKTDVGTLLLNFGGQLLTCSTTGASSTPTTVLGTRTDIKVMLGTGATAPNNVSVTATFHY